jgi:hypothetical protein
VIVVFVSLLACPQARHSNANISPVSADQTRCQEFAEKWIGRFHAIQRTICKDIKLIPQTKPSDDCIENTDGSAEEGRHSSDPESTDDIASSIYSNDDIGAIDAHRWSPAIKWTSSVIISSIAAWVSFAGAIDSQAIKKISSEFGISQEAETLATGRSLVCNIIQN